MVNVEFMLCPTKQMEDIFAAISGNSEKVIQLFVSHRTLMTFVVFIIGSVVSKLYLTTASILAGAMGNNQVLIPIQLENKLK